MPDRIEERLRALAPDLDRVGLADPGAVRRRGERRTRNQALGSAVAGVLLLAGVVGVSGGLSGDRQAVVAPPARDGATASTTPAAALSLAPQPLLRDGDLTGVGPFGDFLDTGDQPADRLLSCIDVPGAAAGAERASTVLHETEIGEPAVHEHVLRLESESAASRLVLGLSAAFRSCDRGDPGEATVTDRGPESFGQAGGLRASRLTTPTADAGIGYYELAVTSKATVVVVLEWSSMGNPVGQGPGDWVWTADRLQVALARAVG